MKFENICVYNFGNALRGMRNPKNSWAKGDTIEYFDDYDTKGLKGRPLGNGMSVYIGPNDMKLAQTLIRSGSEHRKFMRQIMVSVDITAPLYLWKELDTYKVGTTANSTSTMHKLASTPITLDCFEIDDYEDGLAVDYLNQYEQLTKAGKASGFIAHWHITQMADYMVSHLEELRQQYLKTKDKRYWKELIRWLPESWLQTRTVTMSYENLLAMCSKGQRRFHKLTEWSGDGPDFTTPSFIKFARSLPYAQELIFLDELD